MFDQCVHIILLKLKIHAAKVCFIDQTVYYSLYTQLSAMPGTSMSSKSISRPQTTTLFILLKNYQRRDSKISLLHIPLTNNQTDVLATSYL